MNMVNDDVSFDLDNIDSALPKGVYSAFVDSIEYKPNKKRTGHFLLVTVSVNAPGTMFHGALIHSAMNVQHEMPITQAIGRRQLAAFLKACTLSGTGSPKLGEIKAACIGAPLRVKLEVDDDPKYGKTNVVKDWLVNDASSSPATNPSQQTRPQMPQTSSPPQTWQPQTQRPQEVAQQPIQQGVTQGGTPWGAPAAAPNWD